MKSDLDVKKVATLEDLQDLIERVWRIQSEVRVAVRSAQETSRSADALLAELDRLCVAAYRAKATEEREQS